MHGGRPATGAAPVASSVVTQLLLAAALMLAQGSGTPPTIPDCFTRVVAPRTVTLACGDGNFWLGGLRWSGWGAATATATGTAHANDCKPYCAAGHFHAYPVTVAASRPATCLGGLRQYTRLSLRYTAARRPGARATETETFPCTWPLHPGLTARRSSRTVALSGTAWARRRRLSAVGGAHERGDEDRRGQALREGRVPRRLACGAGPARRRRAADVPRTARSAKPSSRPASAPSSNPSPLLAGDHAARKSTLDLAQATGLRCGRVRPLAWCSPPRNWAQLLEAALVQRS